MLRTDIGLSNPEDCTANQSAGVEERSSGTENGVI